jgi:trypsin
MAPLVRIVGGDVQQQVLPWMASVQTQSLPGGAWSHRCGGALVSPSHVLSAAHCVVSTNTFLATRVVVGALNQANVTSESNAHGKVSVVQVRKAWAQPGFQENNSEGEFDVKNDLGIYELSEAVTSVLPVRLSRDVLLEQEPHSCVVSGWGSNNVNATTQELMSVVLPIVSQAACNQSYPAIIHSNMFCTLYEGTPGKDSCRGDSGGPAWTCDGDGHGVLLGTVSYGDQTCAKPGSPGVLMSVAQSLAWVTAQTGYTRPADAQAPDDTFCVGSATQTPTAPTSSAPPTSAPTSFSPTALQPGSSGEGLSSGAIAGIVIGAVLGAALLALLLFKLFAGRAQGGGSPSAGAPPGAASASAPPADKAATGASAPASADASAPPSQMQRV